MPFWGSFGSNSRAQSKRLWPVCNLFLTYLAAQNDFNGPKFSTVGQGITTSDWWGPLGAILVMVEGPKKDIVKPWRPKTLSPHTPNHRQKPQAVDPTITPK